MLSSFISSWTNGERRLCLAEVEKALWVRNAARRTSSWANSKSTPATCCRLILLRLLRIDDGETFGCRYLAKILVGTDEVREENTGPQIERNRELEGVQRAKVLYQWFKAYFPMSRSAS